MARLEVEKYSIKRVNNTKIPTLRIIDRPSTEIQKGLDFLRSQGIQFVVQYEFKFCAQLPEYLDSKFLRAVAARATHE